MNSKYIEDRWVMNFRFHVSDLMRLANEKRRYNVTLSLIGWAQT